MAKGFKPKSTEGPLSASKPVYPRSGRPLMFQTVEEFANMAAQYFEDTPYQHWTVTGLAIALGTTRETLNEYEHREGYVDAVKYAKSLVENSYEILLKEKGHAGAIFGMKNMGWKDKTEVDNNLSGGISMSWDTPSTSLDDAPSQDTV